VTDGTEATPTVGAALPLPAVDGADPTEKPIELILLRQLASYLTMPIFVVDNAGALLYYNEAAEGILGHRFEETGEMPVEEWGTMFAPVDALDVPVSPEDLPLVVAVRERHPAHGPLVIRGRDGVLRRILITAFPIEGQHGRQLGAVAIFWEDGGP